jgi:hypothetical protein
MRTYSAEKGCKSGGDLRLGQEVSSTRLHLKFTSNARQIGFTNRGHHSPFLFIGLLSGMIRPGMIHVLLCSRAPP